MFLNKQARAAMIVLIMLFVDSAPWLSATAQRTASAGSKVLENEKSSDNGFSTADFLPSEKNRPESLKSKPIQTATVELNVSDKVPVRFFINTPHNRDSINTFTCFPYPMEPPAQKQRIKPLPQRSRDGLKAMLLSSGYTARATVEKAYPAGGWRWRFAYQTALKKSNLSEPHIIGEMYGFCDDMVPFILPIIIRLNEVERERRRRYTRATQDFKDNRDDIESASIRKGYYPVDVRIEKFSGRQQRYGTADLPPGKWWAIGTHKVAGLKYYWQESFEVEPGKPMMVELNEDNALVIEGAW